MIEYDIDITEAAYSNVTGNTNNVDLLYSILHEKGRFIDCVGTIKKESHILKIAAVKENGVYLGYDGERQYVSCLNIGKMDHWIDVWGDGLFVSEGLFIEPELAWKAICQFVQSGTMLEEVKWILCSEIPEEGNYI